VTTCPKHAHTSIIYLSSASVVVHVQAAYQEVHSFAMYGGAGSHSVAANLHTLKGSSGGSAAVMLPLDNWRSYLDTYVGVTIHQLDYLLLAPALLARVHLQG
jgi:hypothetical protein